MNYKTIDLYKFEVINHNFRSTYTTNIEVDNLGHTFTPPNSVKEHEAICEVCGLLAYYSYDDPITALSINSARINTDLALSCNERVLKLILE